MPYIAQTAVGKRGYLSVFGSDYDTHDGTGIRDYIHVVDLAIAHVKAIEYLEENDSDIFNVGYGKGYSVKEVVETVKEVTKVDFTVKKAKRRAGDPAILISDNSKIKQLMHWKPKYQSLSLICESVYKWENLHD